MLDEKDLQATAQLVDTRLDTAVKQLENKIEHPRYGIPYADRNPGERK